MKNEEKYFDSSDIISDDFTCQNEAEKDLIIKTFDEYLVDYDESRIDDSKVVQNLLENTKVNINVFDVASYILHSLKHISTMKLQKLVYYCQAWSLVWDEKPMFPESIQAWANGPVVRELFYQLKGMYNINEDDLLIGNYKKLNDQQIETIESVLEHYGDKSAQWLITLSHMEEPWRKARAGLPEGVRSNRVIELEDIASYYSSL